MGAYLSTNTNYLTTVSRGGAASTGITGGLTVIANSTAKLRIAIENKWVNILEALGITGPSGDGLISSVIGGAQIVGGANFLPTILTSHVWRGSSGIELTLELRFDAWNDPVTDVVAPVKTLLSMFSPTRSGSGSSSIASFAGSAVAAAFGSGAGSAVANSFLAPPGPTPASFWQNGTNDPMLITVMLGNVMKINNLIPTTIGWEFEERFASSGQPMCALISAGFISYTIPALDEILAFFTAGATANINSSASAIAGQAATTNPNVSIPSSTNNSGSSDFADYYSNNYPASWSTPIPSQMSVGAINFSSVD